MNDDEIELLESLTQRGKELLVKFNDARGAQSFIDFLRFAGNISVSDLGHQDRDFLRNLGGQTLNLLPKPMQDVVNEYYRWYLDCRNFFSLMKWNSEKRVKDFEDAISKHSGLDDVKPETLLDGQIMILESFIKHPPLFGTISWIRVAGFVIYLTLVTIIDYIVFPFIEASVMVGIVALELGFLELLPTLGKIIQR
ncbi:MAG: hypothetical protein ACTSSE_18580 [Candidatus Thorarchaeota archaeon]